MVKRKSIETEMISYLNGLQQTGINIERAIVFGSMVKGNPTVNSDIDLAVWSKDFGANYYENIEKVIALKRTHKKIELHPFPIEENATNNPFIAEIEQTGKLIEKPFAKISI